jgi:transcriptional regulator with XRE-family HTH domain
MAVSAFGILLQRLREDRRLSLRQLAQLTDIDHAYIYRLETGEKESPSEEVVAALIKVLKADERVAAILRFLATSPQTDWKLAEKAVTNPKFGVQDLGIAAQIRFRGAARPDPEQLLERARKLREETERG